MQADPRVLQRRGTGEVRKQSGRSAINTCPPGIAQLKPTARNNSILIHGFEAVGPEDAKPLKDLYARLEYLLIQDTGDRARAYLAIARSLDFSAS